MSEMITLLAADGHSFAAYRTGPANAARGLVVVQEIFGVNQHIRNVCDRFAQDGYAVVAPALFDRVAPGTELGYNGPDVERGMKLRAGVSDAGSLADIEAAAEALGKKQLGIIGYCWGGTLAWAGATRSTLFRAAVGWYGGGIAATKDAKPGCPVQLHFGEHDHGIPLTDVDAIRAAQPGVEVFVYPGAQHGFGCDERASFDAASYQLARERSLAFLSKHLAGE